jgi:stress response protein YsnF
MAITDRGVLRGWGGHDLVDRDGVKAGSIVDLYVDGQTGQPTWGLVRTGLLGSRQTLVPLGQATVPLAVVVSGAGSVQVPFESAAILDAPSVAVGEEISEATAIALHRYYGLGDPAAPAEGDHGPSDTGSLDAGAATPAAQTTAAITSASTEPSGTMIRSEEELRVRLRRRARRVRVKRYVVTDYVTTTIPVSREELRLEETLGDEASRTAPPAPAPPGASWEMVLHQEEPVVSKQVVARERVRLHVETITEQRRISGEVRKERIEVDDSSLHDEKPAGEDGG